MNGINQRIQKFETKIQDLKSEIAALRDECEYWKNQWHSYFRTTEEQE